MSEITPGSIKITSVDFFINKSIPITGKLINLDVLATGFELDENDGFTRLEYSSKVGKGGVEKVINRPAIGPIPVNFICRFCEKIGPENHSTTCPKPNKRSLFLTYDGFKDIMERESKPPEDLYESYKLFNDGNKIKTLKKHFPEYNENKIPPDAMSNIEYTSVFKIRGKTPEVSGKVTRFSNIVSIFYVIDGRSSNIRVYNSGMIDIKNVPSDLSIRKKMLYELFRRINDADCVNYNLLNPLVQDGLLKESTYNVIDKYSFTYLIHAQFNISDNKINEKDRKIDFNNLFIKVSENPLISTPTGDLKLTPRNPFDLTSTAVNSYIIKDAGSIKITCYITQYGVFQFSISSDDGKINPDYAYNLLKHIRLYFIDIFENNELTIKTFISSEPLFYNKYETQDTTVSGLIPPKTISQRVGTEVCRKTIGGVYIQPKPYTWGGTCPEKEYVPAIGLEKKYQGGDIEIKYMGKYNKLFYPCCINISKNASINKYINKIKSGLTEDELLNSGITPLDDILSGVLIPGSTDNGAISKVIIPGEKEYTDVVVIEREYKSGNDIIYKVMKVSDSTYHYIPRVNFKKSSRFFPGLNNLSKYQLIKILESENLIDRPLNRKLTEIMNLKINDITLIFTKKNYKFTSLPGGEIYNSVILAYNNKSDQKFISMTTPGLSFSSDVEFIDNSKVIGLLGKKTKYFYPLFMIGAGDLLSSISIIRNNLRGDLVKIIRYSDDYIHESYITLTKNPENILFFTPNNLSGNIYKYDKKSSSIPKSFFTENNGDYLSISGINYYMSLNGKISP